MNFELVITTTLEMGRMFLKKKAHRDKIIIDKLVRNNTEGYEGASEEVRKKRESG